MVCEMINISENMVVLFLKVISVIMKKTFSSFFLSSVLLGFSVFLVSCGDPQKAAVKQLEKNQYSYTVADFLVAAGAGDLENLLLFMDAGMDIEAANTEGNTALIQASSNGRTAAVEKILGLGADPLHRNRYGRDALISASAKGFEEVARLLVARGSDLHAKDSEGWNALSIAAYNGHESVVSLLASQANQEMLDNALLLAAFNGNSQVIQTLLSQGAYINARSPENQTPLMIASASGHKDAVVVFLQNQANPYSTDDSGQTAAVIAEEKGYAEIRELILQPGEWGESEEGLEIAEEIQEAQDALVEGSVEEELEVVKATPQDSSPAQSDPSQSAPVGTASVQSTSEESAPAETATVGNASRSESTGVQVAVADTATASANNIPAPAKPVSASKTAPSHATTQLSAPVAKGSIPVPSSSAAPVAVTTRPKYTYPQSNPGSAVTPQAADQLREQAKDRPMASLNGSVIKSRDPQNAAVESFVLASYRERPIPIAVNEVEGSAAQVRMLDESSSEPVKVEQGHIIPGTTYQVEEVTHKMVNSKEGKGKLVDVSQVKVKDTRTGSSHLLVKDVSGSTSDSYAILAAPGSDYRYVVKTGDTFRTDQPGVGVRDYQVLDIRPTGVVIKDVTTGQVMTVARDGVVAP